LERKRREREEREERKFIDFIRSQEVEKLPLVIKEVTVESIKESIQNLINESISYEQDVKNLTQLKKFVRKKLKRAKRKIKGIQEWEKETHAAQRPTETIGDLL